MPGTRDIDRTGTAVEIGVKVMKRHMKSLVVDLKLGRDRDNPQMDR